MSFLLKSMETITKARKNREVEVVVVVAVVVLCHGDSLIIVKTEATEIWKLDAPVGSR